MKRGPGPKRKKRVNPFNAKRRAENFARAYGSEERLFYVSACLACVVPSCTWNGYNDNAHVETGGTGRKADADKVVSACNRHHREMHRGQETFELTYGVDLQQCAAETQERWTLYGPEVVERAKADGRFDAWKEARDAA